MKKNNSQKTKRSSWGQNKSWYEKINYSTRLNSKVRLSNTVIPEDFLGRTTSSTVDDPFKSNEKKSSKRPKEFKYQFKKFFKNEWTVGIGTALISSVVISILSYVYFLGGMSEKVENLTKNQDKNNEKIESIEKNLNSLFSSMEILKVSTSKDIEYIKNLIMR